MTKVQKIMAFNKVMVNHKLEEVKHLFVRLIPFKLFPPINLDYWYTWTIFCIYTWKIFLVLL